MPLPKPTMSMQARGQLVRPIFDKTETSRHIQFNTNRPYTEDGQIIEAIHDNIGKSEFQELRVEELIRGRKEQLAKSFNGEYTEVRFYDHIRQIGGTIIVWDLEDVASDMAFREFVMHAYLHNQFNEDFWSTEGLLHYEMNDRIRAAHAGSTPATKVRELPNGYDVTPWWKQEAC